MERQAEARQRVEEQQQAEEHKRQAAAAATEARHARVEKARKQKHEEQRSRLEVGT